MNQFNHRIAEFESLARLLDVEMEWVERNGVEPWVIVDLAGGEEAARRILSRSISAKYCIQGFEFGKYSANILRQDTVETCYRLTCF